MCKLRHPNIVIFMGFILQPMCLVTEYCHNGNLFDIIHTKERKEEKEEFTIKLPWKRCVRIALDIAKGMNFLHMSTPVIIHRDLK